jgi:hypothetical protein
LYIDNFSVVPVTVATQNTSDLQVGGPNSQGLTLLTLDNYSSAPLSGTTNTNLLGSMYYDTTAGRIQCYEADGWGACGASPTQAISLTPEYPGAVLNGTLNANNNGTMTANLCDQPLTIQPDASLCGTNEIRSYYRWTTTQSSASQVFSIYVRYQLPATFKAFSVNPSLQARTTDSTNGAVTITAYDGSTTCGTGASSSSNNTWQALAPTMTSCTNIQASDTMVFRIDMSAKSSSIAYAGDLTFTFTGK